MNVVHTYASPAHRVNTLDYNVCKNITQASLG